MCAVVGTLLLLGCESAQTRCTRIVLEQLRADYSNRFEDSVETLTARRLRRVAAPTFEQRDSVMKIVRIDLRTAFNEELRKQYGGDSTSWRIDPAKDSLMKLDAPPRPSDIAWSREHCYAGRAR